MSCDSWEQTHITLVLLDDGVDQAAQLLRTLVAEWRT
jgi:hypothetical protein